MQKNKLKQFLNSFKFALEVSQSSLIDKSHYKKQGGRGLSRIDMVKHYLNEGWKLGLDLSPYFSSEFYLRENPDVAEAGIAPFLHFLRAGASELRSCHPDFDKHKAISLLESKGIKVENYLEQTIAIVEKGEIAIGEVFSNVSRFYSSAEKALVKDTGLFDAEFYLTSYPDIAKAGVDPLTHYLEFGWKEDRNPSVGFDTFFYKNNISQSFDNECPLLHYAKNASATKHETMSSQSLILNQNGKIQENSEFKIAIHVHLFYPDVLRELIPLFQNLDSKIDIFITTVSKYKEERVKGYLRKASLENKQEIIRVKNIGRDIAPMVVALGTTLLKYDFVCHLHSKKSPHTHFGDRWRAYLFDQLIGSQERVENILSVLQTDKTLGVIYPDNYFEIKKFTGWNGNYQAFKDFFSQQDVNTSSVNEEKQPEFPAGSMCWFKPKALEQLFAGNITLTDFESEDSQEEGTLAHVIERALGVLPNLNGFTVAKYHANIVDNARYSEAWSLPDNNTVATVRRDVSKSRWLRDTPMIALNERLPLSPSYPFYNKDSLTIHWVIPDFGLGAGGHMTIFRMVKYLEEFGHRQTIWIQNAQNYATTKLAKQTISDHYQEIGEGVIVQFLPEDVEWISGDVIIATDCWTVFPVLAMPRFKERFYLIQDWEPMFHPVGDSHLIAELTYSLGFNALCAGDWLHSKATDAGMWARRWKLATDKEIYYPAEEKVDNGELLHVAFYARAYTPRRAVMLGVAALKELDRRGVNLHVTFFGEDNLNFNVSFSHEYLGIMSPDQLGDLYRQSDVGMVFSATNYSLIPLEMMACALPVLELDVESTRAVFDESFIDMVKPDPLAIANRLEALASDPDEIRRKSDKALEYAMSLDWRDSAKDIEAAILEKLAEQEYKVISNQEITSSEKQSAIIASVIIPTYNAGKEFKEVISSLLAQKCDFDYEIVIVDSGSSDETLEIIRSANDAKIKLHEIPNSEFQHGKTRNFAISKSQGDFVAVITQDALPANESWLANLIKGFDNNPEVAGVFGSHKAYEHHSEFVKRDIFRVFERFDMFGDEYNWYFDKLEPGSKEWQFALQYYSDNNSCMRKSVWQHLPYPEIDWGEDQAWAWMIVQLGLTKVYQPDAVVYHSHDDTVEVRAKTSKTEAKFFYDVFGIKLCNPEDDLEDLINKTIESETAYGQHHKIDENAINNQNRLVEAGLKGRFAAFKDR